MRHLYQVALVASFIILHAWGAVGRGLSEANTSHALLATAPPADKTSVNQKKAGCSVTLASSKPGHATVGNRLAVTASATGCGVNPIFKFSVTNVDGSTYTMTRCGAITRRRNTSNGLPWWRERTESGSR